MGRLSDLNMAAMNAGLDRAKKVLEDNGFVVMRSMALDKGGSGAIIVVENTDAVTYTVDQVASGEAYDLECQRKLAAS